jgi:hypothetical protein
MPADPVSASIGRDSFVNEEALALVEGRNSSDTITSLELQLMKNLQLGRRVGPA